MSNLPNSYDPHENSYASYSLIVENFGNIQNGGTCNSNNDCIDANCIGGTCMPVCNKESKSSGCDCTQHEDCKSKNCIDKKCSSTDCNTITMKAATCSCKSDSDCLNKKCDNNKCSSLLPLNSRCFKKEHCASGKCKNLKCTN